MDRPPLTSSYPARGSSLHPPPLTSPVLTPSSPSTRTRSGLQTYSPPPLRPLAPPHRPARVSAAFWAFSSVLFLLLSSHVLFLLTLLALFRFACISIWFPLPPLPAVRLRQMAWHAAFHWSRRPGSPSKHVLYPVLRALFDHISIRWSGRLSSRSLRGLLSSLSSGITSLSWDSLSSLGPSSALSRSPVPLTPAIIARGLGTRGAFPIPPCIWSRFVPPALEDALLSFVLPHPPPLRPLTRAMLLSLRRDSFLHPTDAPPTLHAFVRPKSESKAAFIADLRAINLLSPRPLPAFSLPSLETLAAHLQLAPPGRLWGVSFDLSNFFWTLRLPAHMHNVFRVGSLAYDCLPFGWNLSPIIAQETLLFILRRFLAARPPLCDLLHFLYLDDVLFLHPSPAVLRALALDFVDHCGRIGLVVSPKSQTVPSQDFVWLGKRFTLGQRVAIRPTMDSLARTAAMVVRAGVSSLAPRSCLRLAGNLLWLARPLPGATVFLPGLYFRASCPASDFLSPATLRGALDLVAITALGWHRCSLPSPLPLPLFFDAAACAPPRHLVGLFHPSFGVQSHVAPCNIRHQQLGEAYALEYGTRVLTHLTSGPLVVVGDNIGCLLNGLTLRPRLSSPVLVYLYRRLLNRLFWSQRPLLLYWVPSALNPADHPSRLFQKVPDPQSALSLSLQTYDLLRSSTSLPKFVGLVSI